VLLSSDGSTVAIGVCNNHGATGCMRVYSFNSTDGNGQFAQLGNPIGGGGGVLSILEHILQTFWTEILEPLVRDTTAVRMGQISMAVFKWQWTVHSTWQ